MKKLLIAALLLAHPVMAVQGVKTVDDSIVFYEDREPVAQFKCIGKLQSWMFFPKNNIKVGFVRASVNGRKIVMYAKNSVLVEPMSQFTEETITSELLIGNAVVIINDEVLQLNSAGFISSLTEDFKCG